MKMKEKKWIGDPPDECNICHTAITKDFVDGRMRGGPWANMCMMCHVQFGVGIGTGNGQHYRKRTGDDGGPEWIKVEG